MNDGGAKSIQNISSKNRGGFLHAEAADDFVFKISDADIDNVQSTDSYGGFVSSFLDADLTFSIVDSDVDNVHAEDHSGFLMAMYHKGALDFTIQNTDFTDVYCDDGTSYACTGGVAFIGAVTGTSTMSITGSDFTNVYSTTQGSIMSITGSPTMDLTATVSGGTFLGGYESTDGLMYGSLALYPNIVNNLETVKQGGAFYFGDSGTSTLDADSNTFKYFLNTGEGSVWRLPEGFTMTDDDSFYYENGGEAGGIYWCDACTLTATNGFYQDHVALDGSMGWFKNGFDVTIDQSSIGLAKSFYDDPVTKNNGRGGGYFITADSTGAAQGDLRFTNCDTAPAVWSSSFGAEDYTITHIEANGDGGLIYSDHDNFHLLFNECVWNNYYSGGEGGIIYGKVVDFQKLGTVAACATTNITADGGGAFFSSQQSGVDFSLSGCDL